MYYKRGMFHIGAFPFGFIRLLDALFETICDFMEFLLVWFYTVIVVYD